MSLDLFFQSIVSAHSVSEQRDHNLILQKMTSTDRKKAFLKQNSDPYSTAFLLFAENCKK